MSESRSEPGYYRTKAAHMRRLANQAQNETARSTYLLLEASWLRLAETAEKKADDGQAALAEIDSDSSAPWRSAASDANGGGESGAPAE